MKMIIVTTIFSVRPEKPMKLPLCPRPVAAAADLVPDYHHFHRQVWGRGVERGWKRKKRKRGRGEGKKRRWEEKKKRKMVEWWWEVEGK